MRPSPTVLLALARGLAEFAVLQRWRLQSWVLRHGR
ncbi:MAG: hypothetical protein JWQ76_4443 [Ramlibacter sp.]|nr:hypothetical protein [Ramlibacter sp.]